MERRDFIKQSCSLCMLTVAGMATLSLSSCSSLPIFKTTIVDNKITIPLSVFAQEQLQIVRPKGYEYNIAVKREPDQTYSAILLRCTHADNQLTATGNGFVCNLHGSKFNNNGDVTKGPAEHALQKFKTEVTTESIIITIS